jgi:preprotein translocase subunit SecG
VLTGSRLLELTAVRNTVLWTAAILNVASLIGLIVFVLLHSGRGGGLSDMFGGASGAALGSTAAERNLNRITLVIALVWIFTTVGLGLMLNT